MANSDEEDKNMNEYINKKYLDMYDTECIGGCGNMTNGSQYCCKTYCISNIIPPPDSDEEEEENVNKKIKISNENNASKNIIENCKNILDNTWNIIEKISDIKRPDNWDESFN